MNANEVAAVVVARIVKYGGRYAVFVLPGGVLRLCPSPGKRLAQFTNRYPNALVGVYDAGSNPSQIERDVEATGRVTNAA